MVKGRSSLIAKVHCRRAKSFGLDFQDVWFQADWTSDRVSLDSTIQDHGVIWLSVLRGALSLSLVRGAPLNMTMSSVSDCDVVGFIGQVAQA